MTLAELTAITRAGPAVIMLSKADMLAMLMIKDIVCNVEEKK